MIFDKLPVLSNHNYISVKAISTSEWFNGTLNYELIHLLLDNRMMSHSFPNVKLFEIIELRMTPKLKMVTFN